MIMSSVPNAASAGTVPVSGTVSNALPAGHAENRDSSDDEGGKKTRSTAMVYDRSLVSDRNGIKTIILRSVYEAQVHLQTRKGESFDALAQQLAQLDEFKPYNLNGRKLQKTFNKLARDIKDAIVSGNEPSQVNIEHAAMILND